jgi:hypothetical protein
LAKSLNRRLKELEELQEREQFEPTMSFEDIEELLENNERIFSENKEGIILPNETFRQKILPTAFRRRAATPIPQEKIVDIEFAGEGDEGEPIPFATIGIDPVVTIEQVVSTPTTFCPIIGIAEQLPLKANTVDSIVSRAALGEDISEFLIEAARVLKPFGTAKLAVNVSTKSQLVNIKRTLKKLPVKNIKVTPFPEQLDDLQRLLSGEEELVDLFITFTKL